MDDLLAPEVLICFRDAGSFQWIVVLVFVAWVSAALFP